MASSFFNMDMYDDQSHKNLVFQILSSQSRLKAKSLHNLLKKKYLISYSYQATYKLLSELVEKNIVIKKDLEYSINQDWLKSEKEKIENLLSNNHTNIDNLYNSDSIKVITFDNLRDLNKYVRDSVVKLLSYFQGEKLYWKKNFCSWLLLNPRDENEFVDLLIKSNIDSVGLVTKVNTLNLQARNYYLNKGIINIKVKNIENYEFITVIGDIIFIAEFDPYFLDEINQIYEQNCENFDISKILDISTRSEKLELKIIKNKNIAQMYKDQIVFGY
ncbi:MAG: hypothetical protein KC550_05655 [Nanoarchaeota archaeon]|nr:hypothetical protein [Nanoarchaeota archaeon]